MSIEERLTKIEQEVAELKRRVGPATKPADLLTRVAGSMAAFPEFDEVTRLGREIRQADSPTERQEPS